VTGQEKKYTTISNAVDMALLLKPDAVLLPEDSRYLRSQFDDTEPKQSMAYFQLLQKNTQTLLIDSGRFTTESGETVLRASVFDGVSKNIWQYDKQYLVPQGEYVPYAYQTLLRLLGFGEVIDAVARESAYRPGPRKQTADAPDYVPALLFCFESVRPDAARTLKMERHAPFVVHPISHGWFHTPKILWQQLDVMLQIQARYSGAPIVSAGNMVAGKLYLPTGEIIEGKVVGAGDLFELREYSF
jgi:apolipoprotein N-acyltransferase